MRDLLDHADLGRYAGQFVWLELNMDNTQNEPFFARHAVPGTPTFFVISAENERVTAIQPGAMSLLELTQFLERGARGVSARAPAVADVALERGDALLAQDKAADAAEAYQQALEQAAPEWPRRDLAQASLVSALQSSRQWQRCAEAAVAYATPMKPNAMFGRTVMEGMWCVVQSEPEKWADAAGKVLAPLAERALASRATVRDHRDELYRTLMYLAMAHEDKDGATKWGERWLRELDSITPTDREERSALDIARVENIQIIGDPRRILPALLASERTMPDDFNASLRVAQMESAAKEYDEAIAACDRGLARPAGPLGRSWLLQTKAGALAEKGRALEAQHALEEALQAAQAIAVESSRHNNVTRIEQRLQQMRDEQRKNPKKPE